MIYVNLKEQLVSKDENKRLMATQMIAKFEKYWSQFSAVLAITVVLDPCLNYYYMKIYGVIDSVEFVNVRDKLRHLYMEYIALSTISSSTVVDPQGIKHHQEQELD